MNNEISKAVEDKLIDMFFMKPFDVELIKSEVAKVVSRIS
jgi:hypothetical protein